MKMTQEENTNDKINNFATIRIMETKMDKLLREIKKLQKQIDDLDSRLNAHIDFIEKVYVPLQKSIDRFKKFFK